MKQSSADLPLWREGGKQQRPARLYHLNTRNRIPSRIEPRESPRHAGSVRTQLDSAGKLAELIARQSPFATVINELIRSLCSATGAACGVSFLDEGRLRVIAGPQRLSHFWRAHMGTTTTAKFRQALQRGEFTNPCPISHLGETADAAELQMLGEAIGFHEYIAVPLGNGPDTWDVGVLELFHEEPGSFSAQKVVHVRAAVRIAQIAFASRL